MTTRELLEKVTQKEGINFLNSKKTDKEIYNYFVSKGLTDSYETFILEATKFANEVLSTKSKEEILSQLENAELTDKELQQIAGGKDDDTKEALEYTGVAVGGTAIAVGAMAAMAAEF